MTLKLDLVDLFLENSFCSLESVALQFEDIILYYINKQTSEKIPPVSVGSDFSKRTKLEPMGGLCFLEMGHS